MLEERETRERWKIAYSSGGGLAGGIRLVMDTVARGRLFRVLFFLRGDDTLGALRLVGTGLP